MNYPTLCISGVAFALEIIAPGDILALGALKYALAAAATIAISWRIAQLSAAQWRNPETIPPA